MKTILKILLLLAVAGYLVFAVVKFARPAEDQTCEALDIYITDTLTTDFVNTDYVHSILSKNKVYVEGQLLKQINIHELEQMLTEDPYIDTATCYCTAANHLCINVTPETPILHVITQNENYYLDSNGVTMPVGNFNIDLCVATGNITKTFAKEHLIELAKYIHEDEFWDSQIEQIHVVNAYNIELYPRVGEHIIKLGSTEGLADKMDRLMLFYKKGLTKVGWNKYKTIDLSFDGQVVCTKNDNNKKKTR